MPKSTQLAASSECAVYNGDSDALRGIVNGCIFGLLGWMGIALIAWAIWKAVHHA
jgi:hypothetical protein